MKCKCYPIFLSPIHSCPLCPTATLRKSSRKSSWNPLPNKLKSLRLFEFLTKPSVRMGLWLMRGRYTWPAESRVKHWNSVSIASLKVSKLSILASARERTVTPMWHQCGTGLRTIKVVEWSTPGNIICPASLAIHSTVQVPFQIQTFNCFSDLLGRHVQILCRCAANLCDINLWYVSKSSISPVN